MSIQMQKAIVLVSLLMAFVASAVTQQAANPGAYAGFDSNEYPGDALLPVLHKSFAFAGYWLTNPPGAHSNAWVGKREALLRNGFGFLVLANGKLDNQIKRASVPPTTLGRKDAATAVAAAKREHFPPHTIIFLDQEEGGRLLPEQMAYLLSWTEAVAASGFRPGVYASGQAVPDGPGHTITTAQDIREHVAAQHLHEVALWVYQDACPPAPGCVLPPPPLAASGTAGAIAWQYAQSPRRPSITASCGKTYAPNGNCYAGVLKTLSPELSIDLSTAASPDPSEGH